MSGDNYQWVPILKGKRLNYHYYFSFTASSVVLILAFISFILNLLFRKLADGKKSNRKEIKGTSSYRFV